MRKWRNVLALSFLALSGVLTVFLTWHFARSVSRFSAKVQMRYYPGKAPGVETMGAKALLQVLNNMDELKPKVAERLHLAGRDRECIRANLKLEQAQKDSDMLTITSQASSWVGAVRQANTYAEILAAAYAEYRVPLLEKTLASWREAKSLLLQRAADLDTRENIEKAAAGVASPAAALVSLNAQLSDQRMMLSTMNMKIANEEARAGVQKRKMRGYGEKVVAHGKTIREMSDALAKIEDELAKLRQTWTDEHEPVKHKIAEREAFKAKYEEFRRKSGLSAIPVEDMEQIERDTVAYGEMCKSLEIMKAERVTLERSIAEGEKRLDSLNAACIALDKLARTREDVEKSMRKYDEDIHNVQRIMRDVGNDLIIVREAGGAGDKRPVNVKNIALAVVGAVAGTGVIALWILVAEFYFGCVKDTKELAAWEDIQSLGALPAKGAVPEAEEKDVMGVVAQEYCKADLPKGVVLACRLPGTPDKPEFIETLEWTLSMAGQRLFTMYIVPGADFSPPEGSEPMLSASKRGREGWFPVENRYMLAQSEMEMLRADLATLRDSYDNVILFMPDGLRKGGSFFGQLLDICESVLVMVCAGKTRRHDLKYARRHIADSGKPAMGIVMGASAADVRKEMES